MTKCVFCGGATKTGTEFRCEKCNKAWLSGCEAGEADIKFKINSLRNKLNLLLKEK